MYAIKLQVFRMTNTQKRFVGEWVGGYYNIRLAPPKTVGFHGSVRGFDRFFLFAAPTCVPHGKTTGRFLLYP